MVSAATCDIGSALGFLNVFNINKPNLIALYNPALFSRIQCGG